MWNYLLDFAMLFEVGLALILSYIKELQMVFGTRSVACAHFGIPAMIFFTTIFFFDEARKVLLRSGIDKSVKGKVKYTGWIARNTHW